MKPAKVGILSLGCSRNLVDSEVILGRLSKKGYKVVDIEKADIGLVNTCSFIDEATQESVDGILDLVDLKKKGRLKKVIVSGCLVQRFKEKLLPELREVDAFIGRPELNNYQQPRYSLSPKHFAYVKVSEGCNHGCSFCVIPKIKGPLKSRKVRSILEEVRQLDRQGKSEVNIIGQDISTYGMDLYARPSLSSLLKDITGALQNIRWVRLLYLHPNYLTADLVRVVACEPKICKYIDLPLQHINNRILKAMNRNMTKDKILRLLDYLRKEIPNLCIRTTLIVGFPGETEEEFKELLNFVKEEKFARLGVFRYSEQQGTRAFRFKHQIPEKVRLERLDIIMRAQQKISREFNVGLLGKEIEVLIDEKGSDGSYLGRSSFDAPEVDGLVYVKSARNIKPGEFKRVKIIDAYEYDLIAEVV